MSTAAGTDRLHIGGIVYRGMDQLDFTGPFEVLSRLPNSTFHTLAKGNQPVRDVVGLMLTPDMEFAETPALDLLVVPGGPGQEELMEDECTLSFLRRHAESGAWMLSVCTGALLCGAAGLLQGVRATTHWRAMHLLPYFGAIPVNERVVVDGRMITAAGVTSGIDGALRAAALLRGERTARTIQLLMEYGSRPDESPADVLELAQRITQDITERRERTASRLRVD